MLQVEIDSLNEEFCVSRDELTATVSKQVEIVRHCVLETLRLCQRSSSRLDEKQRESIWFPLLDSMLMPQRMIDDVSSPHFLVFKVIVENNKYISIEIKVGNFALTWAEQNRIFSS